MTDVRVYPCSRLEGRLSPPSSKNYTTRYLLASALCEGESLVLHPAESDDADAMIRCLRDLGARITPRENGLHVRGFGRHPRNPGVLNPGNAGAVMRFLLGPASFLPEVRIETDHHDSLGKRPHGDLLDALERIGVEAASRDGMLPITLRGGKPRGGRIEVSGAVSSQYLSSLLFLTPLLDEDSRIEVTGGLKSKAPVRTTLSVLREAAVQVEASPDLLRFDVPGRQTFAPGRYVVPGDYPGAAAILCAAAVVDSDVTVPRLLPDDEQGEKAVVDVLASMGADIVRTGDEVRVRGGRPLAGIEFDGDRATDAVLAMAAAAALADGTTRFYNVENLRYKECDRISDFRAELLRAGVRAAESRTELIVHGSPGGYEGGVAVDARNDHRVIMAMTIIGLRSRNGLIIRDAHHVAKSYPRFLDDLRSLGARIEEIAP